MGKLTIAWQNLVDHPDTTVTHSTEVAGFLAENVQAPQLARIYRTSVRNPGYVGAQFGSTKLWQLAALLGCRVSAWANQVEGSGSMDSAPWSTVNATIAAQANTVNPEGEPVYYSLTDNATSAAHYVTQAITPVLDVEHGLVVPVWARADTLTKCRLSFVGDASGVMSADFDLGAGTVIGSSGADATEIVQGEAPFADWYRCAMQISPSDSDATWNLRIVCLNAAGASSYSGSGDSFDVAAPQVAYARRGSLWVPSYYQTGSDRGAVLRVNIAAPSYEHVAFSLSGNEADRGTSDSYFLAPTPQTDSTVTLEVYDADNSQIDIGRAFVGPVWQPRERVFVDVATDDAGPFRKWTLNLNQHITDAERWDDFALLRRELQVVDSSLLQQGPAGHLFALDAKPVLVILDPDETTAPHEQLIYGWLVGMTSQRVFGRSSNAVQLEIWEAIP